MRYLIQITDPKTGKKSAFYTEWYDYNNNYSTENSMIVIDLSKDLITYDGQKWEKIEYDHL